MSRVIILINALLALGVAAWSIADQERAIAEGQTVILPLAPVDPRSLIQGDYMALDFQLRRSLQQARFEADADTPCAWVRVDLDAGGVGTFGGLVPRGAPRPAKGVVIRCDPRGDQADLTDAWFFQEGQAPRFETAQFGLFRITADGRAFLVNLLDEAQQALGRDAFKLD